MPITLTDSEAIIVPEKVTPSQIASVCWLSRLLFNVPRNGKWSAVVEGNPMTATGEVITRHPVTGDDTTIRVETDDLFALCHQSPLLAQAVNAVMENTLVATSEIRRLLLAQQDKPNS